jgi:hypothetical protein
MVTNYKFREGNVCDNSQAKFLLRLLNFMLLVAGSLLLGAAIWAAWDKHSFIAFIRLTEDEELRTKLADIAESKTINRHIYVIIVALAFMLFTNYLGYRGATRESRYLISYYALLNLVILLMEMFAVYLTAAYAFKGEKEIKTYLRYSLERYFPEARKNYKNDMTILWDRIMVNFQCCALNDYQPLAKTVVLISNHRNLMPKACCILKDAVNIEPIDSSCVSRPSDENSYWRNNCDEALGSVILETIKKNTNIVIGIISGLVLSQSLGMILASSLYQSIWTRNLKSLYTSRRRRRQPLPEDLGFKVCLAYCSHISENKSRLMRSLPARVSVCIYAYPLLKLLFST